MNAQTLNKVQYRHSILLASNSITASLALEDDLVENYAVSNADSFQSVAEILHKADTSLLIIDDVAGSSFAYTLCEQVRKAYGRDRLCIILVSDRDSDADESYALSLGANDYIRKPASTAILLARVHMHLELYSEMLDVRYRNQHLEDLVHLRTKEIVSQADRLGSRNKEYNDSQSVLITAACILAEYRDNETGHHVYRTQRYVQLLAQKLSQKSKFVQYLSADTIELLFQAAPLHDIGKLAIPDKILQKPGRLNDTEWAVMKRHTDIGSTVIKATAKRLNVKDCEFLSIATDIALSHHEKWDGSGYPNKLKGADIPLAARIMAVADVYDALISKRVYKKAYSHSKAIAIMMQGRGLHFDPDIVDVLAVCESEMNAIAKQFPDE